MYQLDPPICAVDVIFEDRRNFLNVSRQEKREFEARIE
jgi:hypothetical protein